MDTETKKNS